MATVLNDEALGSATNKQVNHAAWVERYQNAPAITQTEGAAGHGFTTAKDPDFTEKLRAREDELSRAATSQDKDRLGLLLNAERAHCGIDPTGQKEFISQHKVRESLGALMEYDKGHGHPITDLSRDLQKQPYTAKEQVEWLERDDRRKTSAEYEVSHKNGWNDTNVHKGPEQKAQSDWHVAPQVKERQERETQRQDQSQNATQGMDTRPQRKREHTQSLSLTA